jgi:predicted ATPase/DNA-binding SARP family transcriptional activator
MERALKLQARLQTATRSRATRGGDDTEAPESRVLDPELPSMNPPALTLRVLGELAVERDGLAVELPPSKKTRALLAYLAITGRAHRRARLCSLLWDVAGDPRGALRWSLSRLRPILDDDQANRLVADRDSVELHLHGAVVDLLEARRHLAGDPARIPLDELRRLGASFRGELLEGLDLGEFDEFGAWCVAEREAARKLHVEVLTALRDRLVDEPAEAIVHARALAQIDPLDESAHVALVRLLVQTDRWREAEHQLDAARRMFKDLRNSPPRTLEEAWRGLRDGRAPKVAQPPPGRSIETDPPPSASHSMMLVTTFGGRPPFVGREGELTNLRRHLEDVRTAGQLRVVLLAGEPGVGKSRLVSEMRGTARQDGTLVLRGAAYEAQEDRPYGPWIDALRKLPRAVLGTEAGQSLGRLLPEVGAQPEAIASRERLFEAVSSAIAVCTDRGAAVMLTFDDVQWLDEASVGLLHYLVRTQRARPVLVLLVARKGELSDNVPLLKLLRGLRRDRTLHEWELGPLRAHDVAALALAINPGADAQRIAADSGGNALFALELARAGESGVPAGVTGLVRDRVDRLSLPAAELLRWGAVLGRTLDVTVLGDLRAGSAEELVTAFAELERHALVETVDDPEHPRGAYAFAHDLVRQAVYGEISTPRRRLMHWRIAEALSQRDDPDGSIAAEVAHHAMLAGDAALAVRACIGAAKRCLRMFANVQAESFARRGLRLVDELAEPVRTRLRIELWELTLGARRPTETTHVAEELEDLGRHALDLDLREHARLAFHLLAYLRWEAGEWADAARHMLHAARVSQGTGEAARITALGEAAKCLVLVERDLPQAEAMALEAEAMASRLALRPAVVTAAHGLLRLHQGELDAADALFSETRDRAQEEHDRELEFQAVEHLVYVALARADLERAELLCLDLVRLGRRLREGAEAPYAEVLAALTAHARAPVVDRLDAALVRLRAADAKHRLAYALARAAEIELDRGALDRALAYATEALEHAEVVARPSEQARAHAALAEIARARSDQEPFAHHRMALEALLSYPLAADVRPRVDTVLAQVPGAERCPS